MEGSTFGSRLSLSSPSWGRRKKCVCGELIRIIGFSNAKEVSKTFRI